MSHLDSGGGFRLGYKQLLTNKLQVAFTSSPHKKNDNGKDDDDCKCNTINTDLGVGMEITLFSKLGFSNSVVL